LGLGIGYFYISDVVLRITTIMPETVDFCKYKNVNVLTGQLFLFALRNCGKIPQYGESFLKTGEFEILIILNVGNKMLNKSTK
jgi:hypothetical protein